MDSFTLYTVATITAIQIASFYFIIRSMKKMPILNHILGLYMASVGATIVELSLILAGSVVAIMFLGAEVLVAALGSSILGFVFAYKLYKATLPYFHRS